VVAMGDVAGAWSSRIGNADVEPGLRAALAVLAVQRHLLIVDCMWNGMCCLSVW